MISDPIFALPPSIAALKSSLLSATALSGDRYLRRGIFYTFSGYARFGSLLFETNISRLSDLSPIIRISVYHPQPVWRVNMNAILYVRPGVVRSSSRPVRFKVSSNGGLVGVLYENEEFNRHLKILLAGVGPL